MKNKNILTTTENNKKTKTNADSSNKQEVELKEISDIENDNNEEIEQNSNNNHIQKNFFSKYLELKNPLPNDGSPISYLNCENLLSTIHSLYSNKTYNLPWLFDNNELTTTKSIFYQLLSPYWSTIQDTPALNTQMSKLLIGLINLQLSVSSKNKVFSELMGTLSLKQSWIELLLDYYHEQVNESYKSWLLSFLDSFVSERKNAYLSCVSLLDKKAQDNYLISLSDTEVNQVRELLNAFNNPCFTLTLTNGQYQLAVVNQENYAKLKQALRFSLSIKVSFSTHQKFLKEILTEIVQNHPEKDGGIQMKMDKNTVRYLNSIYKPYLHLSTKTMGTAIEVIDSANCLELAKTFQPDISIKQIPPQKSNSSPFISNISNISNNNRLDLDRPHSINQSSDPVARKSNERKKASQVSTTNQTEQEPVTLDQSIVEKSKSESFLRLMKTILKKLPATTIFCQGKISLTYARDFNKLYNKIMCIHCSPGSGVFDITIINSNLCLKLAEQLGIYDPAINNLAIQTTTLTSDNSQIITTLSNNQAASVVITAQSSDQSIVDNTQQPFQTAGVSEMPQTNTAHDNQSEQLSIAHPSHEHTNKKMKVVKFSEPEIEQASETAAIQQTTQQPTPRQLTNQSQESLSLGDNTELSFQISEASLMPQTKTTINDTQAAPALFINQSQESLPLIDYTEPSFQISEHAHIPQINEDNSSEQVSIATQETEPTTHTNKEKKTNASEKNKSPQISVPPQTINQSAVESSTLHQSSIDKEMGATLLKLVKTIVTVLPSDYPIILCAGEIPQAYINEFNKSTKEIFQIHNLEEKTFQLTVINPTLCLILARRLGINNNMNYPSFVILSISEIQNINLASNNLQTTTTTSNNEPTTVSITHQSPPQSESTSRKHSSKKETLARESSKNTAIPNDTNQSILGIAMRCLSSRSKNKNEAFLKIVRTIVSHLPIEPVIFCEGELSQPHLSNFNKNCKEIFNIQSSPKRKTLQINIINPALCLALAEQLGLIVEVEQLSNISANQLQTTTPVSIPHQPEEEFLMDIFSTDNLIFNKNVNLQEGSQDEAAYHFLQMDTTKSSPIVVENTAIAEVDSSQAFDTNITSVAENQLISPSTSIELQLIEKNSMNEEEIISLIENLATNNEFNSQEINQDNTTIPPIGNNDFQFFSSNQKRQQTALISPIPMWENEPLFDTDAQPLDVQENNDLHTTGLANSFLFFNKEENNLPGFDQSQLEESTYTEFELTDIENLPFQ